MEKETLARIAETVNRSKIEEKDKSELLELLGKLEKEITPLAASNKNEIQSLVGLTEAFTKEAVKDEPSPEALRSSLKELTHSAKSFEMSHPALTRAVNSICMMLSDIGI